MEVKFIVLDVDGTLFNSDKRISDATKDILIDIQNRGIKLIITSDRPINCLKRIAHILKMDIFGGYLIAYNGALVYDTYSNKEVFSKKINKDTVKEILLNTKALKKLKVLIDIDEYLYTENVYDGSIRLENRDFDVIKYESRTNNLKICEVDDMSKFINQDIYKVLAFAEPDYLILNYRNLSENFININASFTSSYYFEYTAKNINKANALKVILDKDGVDAKNIIAFGDDMNDLDVLKMAGVSVAMGNAKELIKKTCNLHTSSNDEDGIVKVLRGFLKSLD